MTDALSSYSLGDISSLLFSASAPTAAKSKKSKSSVTSAPENPFATSATATNSPFAEAARAQVIVAAKLQAEGKRRKEKKSKKNDEGESAAADVSSSSVLPASSSPTSKKKKIVLSSVDPAESGAAAAVAAGKAAAALLEPSTTAASKGAPAKAAAAVPLNGVVNGIVYKDGQRVTNADVTPKLPPGERITDPDKDARTVFVGNVPVSIKIKNIKRHFSPCGVVESVRLRSLPVATPKLSRKGAYATKDFREGASSCNAYVVFAEASSVSAALKLNGSELGGHHVRVDSVGGKGGAAQKFNNRLSLFVGNLDYRVNEEALHAHFSTVAGDGVVAVRCIRDKATSFGKGFAYVHFSTVDALTSALKLDGKVFEGRALRVSRSDGKASLKRSRSEDSPKSPSMKKGSPSNSRLPPKVPSGVNPSPQSSSMAAATVSTDPIKKLKKPRHVPRPGATQPTLPSRSNSESPRPANIVPKMRVNKVKQGALAGIKKKKAQAGKNRERRDKKLAAASKKKQKAAKK